MLEGVGEQRVQVLPHAEAQKGRVTTILTSRSARIPEPRKLKPVPQTSAGGNTRKKGRYKKKLKALLSYQKRLVEENGLPPSRLMLEQAAAGPPSPPPAERVDTSIFKCDLCYYFTHSKHGLSVHRGAKYKNKKKPESNNQVTVDAGETLNEDRNKTTHTGDATENSSHTLKCNFCGQIFPNMLEFNERKSVTYNTTGCFFTVPPPNFLSTKSLDNLWHLEKFWASFHGICDQ